jgi:hypothetical protein
MVPGDWHNMCAQCILAGDESTVSLVERTFDVLASSSEPYKIDSAGEEKKSL